MSAELLQQWHEILGNKDLSALDEALAEDVVFHSPVVHTPIKGKQLTKMYLMAASHVLTQSEFKYSREVLSGNNAILEFEAEVDGIYINGVDMIQWNDEGKIIDFKVMVRPLKAINLLHQMMAAMLESLKKD